MSFLYIAEYDRLPLGLNRETLICSHEPALVEQKISISGSSGQSNAFGPTTKYIRIHTDAICHLMFSPDPTATTSNQRFAADQTEIKGVQPNGKLAVIQGT